MDRINTPTKATDLFGAGKHGFKDGNLGLGIFPTDFDAEWCNAQQEEKMNVIEVAGVVPDAGIFTQLRQALKRLFGGNVTTVSAAMSPFALTADHAGLVIIDATAGNVSVTLPAANLLEGLQYEFRRKDATANTVTITPAGADTIDEGEASIVLASKWTRRIRSNGATAWPSLTASVASQAEVNAGTDDAKYVTSKKLRFGFSVLLGLNGFIALPSWLGGVMFQWGAIASVAANTDVTWTFPEAFPTASVFACSILNQASAVGQSSISSNVGPANKTSIIFRLNSSTPPGSALLFAIGY